MKKAYPVIAILFFCVIIAMGQTPRMVLIEEATNASCPPCASQNPAFDNLLNQNRDKLTAIKYHWYFPGYDPMHNHNVAENNARVAYYGINGVPTATIDGDIPNGPTFSYPGGPHGYTQALIDEYAAIPSPFLVWLSHRISDDDDSIYVDMMIQATETVSGNLVAHMVIVEKEIHFATAPGSNGEKDFLDVMKKMIPNQAGTALPGNFTPGDYMILQGSWNLQNIYDMSQLGVVGFIQNNVNKDVHQAGNSTADPLTPLYDNEANVTEVTHFSATNCLGTVAPKLVLRNNGANPITQAEIHYRVNNESINVFSWTGNLGFLDSEEISLPQIGFEIQEVNQLYVYSVNPNGLPDEYPKNDTIIRVFERAEITPVTVKLTLRTDNNPQETTWEILDSENQVVASGGPYSAPSTIYQEVITLDDLECYLFKIYDAGGDGLTIPGFYAFYHGTNSYIITGTTFGSVDSAYFEVNTTIGIDESRPMDDLSLYPNPAASSFTVAFFMDRKKDVTITMNDLAGRAIMARKFPGAGPGRQAFHLPFDGLLPGVYLVGIETGMDKKIVKLNIVN